MSDPFTEPDDGTPLTEEEKTGLIPAHIAYRNDLNAAEQENIAHAVVWAHTRRRNLLPERFIKDLHRRMLGEVWRWAGAFRTSLRNIGIDHWEIAVTLRVLLDDVKLWVEQKVFLPDEIAVRFHHRLVQIHTFPNGNGRHARLMGGFAHRPVGGRAVFMGQRRPARSRRAAKSGTSPRFRRPTITTSVHSWHLRGRDL